MIKKIIKFLIIEVKSFLEFLIVFFPGASGNYLRGIFYKIRFKKIGKKFNSEIGLNISCPRNISIGDNFRIMRYSSLNACEKSIIEIGNNVSINFNVNINSCSGDYIKIGNNVLIASNVVIRSADHITNSNNTLIINSGHESGKINIGNNVWIGSNCVILKNVTIEDGAVVGAGTVVSKDIKKNEIVVGTKQTKLKDRI